MTFHVPKNKTHHTSAHAGRARVPHLARHTYFPPLTCMPRFLLEEVPRLCLDRAESRGSVALIFLLFIDSFEGNTAIFLEEGSRDYPVLALKKFTPWTHPNLFIPG